MFFKLPLNCAIIGFSFILISSSAHAMKRARSENATEDQAKKRAQSKNPTEEEATDGSVGLLSLPNDLFLEVMSYEFSGSLEELLRFREVSKESYLRTTGFVFIKKGLLWGKKRVLSRSLINARGVKYEELESRKGNNSNVNKEQCHSYFLMGTTVQKLPRYIVEGLKFLNIEKGLQGKLFLQKGDKRFEAFAQRMSGTAIENIELHYKDHTIKGEPFLETKKRKTKGAIGILNNLTGSNVKSLCFVNIMFGSDDFRGLSEPLPSKLEILGLSVNCYEEISEDAWAHFGEKLRSAESLKKIIVENSGKLEATVQEVAIGKKWLLSLLKEMEKKPTIILALTSAPELNDELKQSLNETEIEAIAFEESFVATYYPSALRGEFYDLPQIGIFAKELRKVKKIILPRFKKLRMVLMYGETIETYMNGFLEQLSLNKNKSDQKILIIYPFNNDEIYRDEWEKIEQIKFMDHLFKNLPAQYELHDAKGPYIPDLKLPGLKL